MAEINFYKILGVSQTASQEEIRKVYLKMAKLYHPDKNTEGAEMFKEIGNAYKILSCPDSRKTHDLTLSTPSRRKKATTSKAKPKGPYDASAFFRAYTQPSTPTPPPPPPPPPPKKSDFDIKTTTHITLQQSFTGLAQHYVTYLENIDCPTCHGQRNETKRTHTCESCLGSGQAQRTDQQKIRTSVCKTCNGVGTITTFLKCKTCKGKSLVDRGFHIPVNKGIHNHHSLKVKDRGNLMPDGVTRGDVIIQVFVEDKSSDGLFERRGDNLHLTLNVSLRDALFGYGNRPAFKHLDQRPVFISQTPGHVLKPGSQRTIKGEGMPIFMALNNARGDLLVMFNIVFPDLVNIPQSLDEKRLIYEFFETDEERKAKENAIIIDDDEPMN